MITPRDTRLLNKLLDLSRELDNGLRQRHCACLVKGNRIISLAHNQPISDTFHYKHSRNPYSAFRHAETACLKQVQYRDDLEEMTLYVGRVELNGCVGMSAPCSACANAIRRAGVKRVVYSIKGGIREEWL